MKHYILIYSWTHLFIFKFAEKKPAGNVEVIRGIIKSDGLAGLGRGLGITVCRELVSCGFYFSTWVKRHVIHITSCDPHHRSLEVEVGTALNSSNTVLSDLLKFILLIKKQSYQPHYVILHNTLCDLTYHITWSFAGTKWWYSGFGVLTSELTSWAQFIWSWQGELVAWSPGQSTTLYVTPSSLLFLVSF